MASTLLAKHETFELHSSQTLFAQSWTPESDVRGVIGIVHGLGEHSSRYVQFAERLAQARFRVVAYDQRGHGRTSGKRGDAPSVEGLLDDVNVLIEEMTAADLSLPKFLFGHSFGGMLVLNLVLRRHPRLDGIIASSPLLLPTHPPAPWKQLAGRCLQSVWPSFRFRSGVRAEAISRDPVAVAAYKNDPLVHDFVSARLAVDMLDTGRWTLEHAAELTVPTLLLHGLADSLTSAPASIDFAQRAGRACTLHTFSGLYHSLHWERERDEVFEVVRQWLELVPRT